MRESLGQRKFMSMLFVSSLEMILNVTANLADTCISGHLIGENGVSAVNVMMPLMSVMNFVSAVVSMGISYTYGEAMGKADKKHADELFGLSVIFAAASGLAMFIAMETFSDKYFAFINPSSEVLALTKEYYSFFRFVLIIDPLTIVMSSMVYNDGDELLSNLANISNILGNVVLSIFFAFTLKMGIAGVALGTFAKDVMCLSVLCCHFLRRSNSLHMRIYFSFRDLWDFVRLGFVDSGMYIMWAILMFFMNKFVIARFGNEYLPVLSVLTNFLNMTILFEGVAEAMIPIVGVYYSEGNYPAVRKLMNLVLRVSVFEGIAMSAVLIVFADYVPALFGITDPEIAGCCAYAVRIISSTLVVSAVLYLMETYYMLQDKNIIPVVSSCLRNLVCVLALSVPLGMVWGLKGIWVGFASAQVMTLIICTALLCANHGRKFFPLYLEEIYPIQDYDIRLSPDAVISVRDSAAEFMKSHGIPDITVKQAMILIEETGMLILERNRTSKSLLAEYTAEIHEGGKVRITIRDNGEIFDITDEDLQITSLRSYIVSRPMSIWMYKRNITTMSFNRNIFRNTFEVKDGIAGKLVMK